MAPVLRMPSAPNAAIMQHCSLPLIFTRGDGYAWVHHSVWLYWIVGITYGVIGTDCVPGGGRFFHILAAFSRAFLLFSANCRLLTIHLANCLEKSPRLGYSPHTKTLNWKNAFRQLIKKSSWLLYLIATLRKLRSHLCIYELSPFSLFCASRAARTPTM